MIFIKLFFKKILIISFLSLPIQAFSVNLNIKDKIKAGLALPVSLLVHNCSEYISTLCHELGHAYANKLITGDPINIKINSGDSALKLVLEPWTGYTCFKTTTNKLGETFRTISGPIAGIATTYSQLILIELLEDLLKKRKLDNYKNYIFKPFNYYKYLYRLANTSNKTYKNKNSSFSDNIVKQIKFLRWSRIIGESIYGFTPINIGVVNSDGQRIWETILNKNFSNCKPKINLIGITAAVMFSPILAGLISKKVSK